MAEHWRPVVGYEGSYEVSDRGRVRSLDRIDSAGHRRRGRIKQQSNIAGYRIVRVCRNGVLSQLRVHRMVLEAFVGPAPEGLQACHFPNRDPADNRLENLRWDTGKANLADRKFHGTELVGARNGRAKLDDSKVRIARELRLSGATFAAIAERVGISTSHARKVVVGDNWGHV